MGGLNAVSRGTDLDNRDQIFSASNISTISSRTINETPFQFSRSRLAAPVNDDIGPAMDRIRQKLGVVAESLWYLARMLHRLSDGHYCMTWLKSPLTSGLIF